MFLAMTNKAKRLLYLGYIQKVRTKDLQRGLEELPALLADLPPGFHLLVDLARLESMEPACSTQLARRWICVISTAWDWWFASFPIRRKTSGLTCFPFPLPASPADGHL